MLLRAVVGCVYAVFYANEIKSIVAANNRIENWPFSHFTSLVNKFRATTTATAGSSSTAKKCIIIHK